PLATKLAGRHLAFADNGLGELLAEIKVAPDTFAAEAIEAEHRFCVLQICFVLHAAVARVAGGVKVLQVHTQRSQLREFLGKTGRTIYALGFQQTVFHARVWFSGMHQSFKSKWRRG